jgi:hypothetical protein
MWCGCFAPSLAPTTTSAETKHNTTEQMNIYTADCATLLAMIYCKSENCQ